MAYELDVTSIQYMEYRIRPKLSISASVKLEQCHLAYGLWLQNIYFVFGKAYSYGSKALTKDCDQLASAESIKKIGRAHVWTPVTL